jgi:hypothetical protein
MARYTLDGKRIVNRPARFPVPQELLADIDGQAAKVLKLRADRDGSQSRIRGLELDARQAQAVADATAVRGMRKILNDKAVQLRQQAADVKVRLSRTERTLAEHEAALGALHQEARAWQRGELAGDDE